MTGISPIPADLQSKIALWRMKAVDGTLTQAEMKEAIIYLRAGRKASAEASAASKRKRAIVEIPAAEDLLADMDSL